MRSRATHCVAAAAVLALVAAGVSAGHATQVRYRDPADCGACHTGHHDAWSGSLHALAHTEPIYDRYFIQAARESDGALQGFCAGCHTPVGVLQGSVPFASVPQGPEDTVLADPAESGGVTCEYCHRIEGADEVRNAHFRFLDEDTMLGPFDDADAVGAHGTRQSEFLRSPEFCGACHSVDHPVTGMELELTYQEWKASPWAAEGVRCQDCHMSDRIGAHADTPGYASDLGPERPSVSLHAFRGPNLCFAEEGTEIRRLSEELIASAADLGIGAPEQGPDGWVLPVLVTNKGAGHYIPTGVTELREAWLEIVVADATGQTILHSGALDADGAIAPGSVVYTTVVTDAEGKATTRFWNTVAKVSDRRLPPRETVTERFALPAAPDGCTVTARLLYRSVSPFGLGEVGMPEGEVTVPILTLATAERAL